MTGAPATATPDSSLRREVAVACAISLILTLVASREGRLLTFDGYHYVELAKQFAATWPDRFGNHWPFGWPLSGGILVRLGIPAFHALAGLSVLALTALIAFAAVALRQHPARAWVLVAIGAAPIVAPQIASCLTELPFATALLGLAVSLARWPDRAGLWGAAAFAVGALVLRYAGLVAIAMMAVTLVSRWRDLRLAGRLGEAMAAVGAATLISILLLSLNVLRSGHASGAHRGNPPGLATLPQELGSFGWSAPSALIAGGLRDRIGPHSAAGVTIGAACFAAITTLCVWSWYRPRSKYSRPLAVVALGYSTGMAVLHCIGDFDALYNGRTFLPALAPLAILTAERLTDRRSALGFGCALVTFAGSTAAARGISREIGGDVRPVVAILRSRIAEHDTIAINDHAMAIAAYFRQPAERIWAQNWNADSGQRFLVAAGKPTDRNGRGGAVPREWVDLANQLVSTQRYRYLVQAPGLIALERVAPSPP